MSILYVSIKRPCLDGVFQERSDVLFIQDSEVFDVNPMEVPFDHAFILRTDVAFVILSALTNPKSYPNLKLALIMAPIRTRQYVRLLGMTSRVE